MAISVLSLNTTNAGTLSSLEVRNRQSLSWISRSASISEAHVSHRPRIDAAGVVRLALQTRQRLTAARDRRVPGGDWASRAVCGAIPLRNRDGLRPLAAARASGPAPS